MDLYKTALKKFQNIYSRVQTRKLVEPTAVTLATAAKNGRPSIRVVLLKSWDERGFVFYTNFKSQKGRELLENPWAALCFYWDDVEDQIRVEGPVKPVSEEEADAYWVTRARDSQIGAWASLQSSPLDHRRTFFQRIGSMALKFGLKPIPRPPHWSGFRVAPQRIEFWKKKPFRLHDREVYEKTSRGWMYTLLYP